MLVKSAYFAFVLTSFAGSIVPAFAEDCGPVKAAMMVGAQTPVTTTVTKTDARGTKSVSQIVQTATLKYVQARNGKWYALKISFKDLMDNFKTTKLACQRAGTDTVNGEPATIYKIHSENDGSANDFRLWISAKNLALKSESHVEGATAVSTYDYVHVQAPANAIPMGEK